MVSGVSSPFDLRSLPFFAVALTVGVTAFAQTWDNHKQWVQDFINYIDEGKMLKDPPTIPGRPGISKPMRMIWYSPHYIFSQAHAGTDYVTTQRHLEYNEYIVGIMEKLGILIADGTIITQSQWEMAYDGLHYLRGNSDNWLGQTSTMVFQAIWNAILPTCEPLDEAMQKEIEEKQQEAAKKEEAANAAVAPKDPLITTCMPTSWEEGQPSEIGVNDPLRIVANGATYELRLSKQLWCCEGLRLEVTKLPAIEPTEVLNPDAQDVEVVAYFWTLKDGTGTSCDATNAKTDDCIMVSRRLPLHHDVARGMLYARFVPDYASNQYVFTIRDITEGSGQCAATKVLKMNEYRNSREDAVIELADHGTPDLIGFGAERCKPLLHW